MQIAVIGPGNEAAPADLDAAFTIGRMLAEGGATVVCGGMNGVMEAACAGAWSVGGITVGILPGINASLGNRYLSIAIPTGMGEARNLLVVRSAEAVIAVGGSWGTMSEMAIAQRLEVPLIALRSWTARDNRGAPIVSSWPEAKTAEGAAFWALTQQKRTIDGGR